MIIDYRCPHCDSWQGALNLSLEVCVSCGAPVTDPEVIANSEQNKRELREWFERHSITTGGDSGGVLTL